MVTKHTRRKMSPKKIAAAITAGVLSVAMVAGGAFAYSDFGHEAINRLGTRTFSDVYLHDDFDVEPDTPIDGNTAFNKDVYVENTGDEDVIVRVRFDEMLKIGNQLLVGGDATDKSTWVTHTFPNTTTTIAANGLVTGDRTAANAVIGEYYQWYMTGAYKHFNKGVSAAGDQPIPDHNNPDGSISGHTADAANVIKMSTYVTNPDLYTGIGIDGHWVLDTDGWAYWSNLLEPFTERTDIDQVYRYATNMLLDSLVQLRRPDDNSQYNINVVMQATGISEAGRFISDGNTATANGQDLIERLVGDDIEVIDSTPEVIAGFALDPNVNTISLEPGKTYALNGEVNGVSVAAPSQVVYSIEPPVAGITIENNNILTVAEDITPAPTEEDPIEFTIVATPVGEIEGFPVAKNINGLVVAADVITTEEAKNLISLGLLSDANGDGILGLDDLSNVVELDLSSIGNSNLLALGELGPILPSLHNLVGLDLSGLDATTKEVQDILSALLDGQPNGTLKVLNLSGLTGLTASNATGLLNLGNLTNLTELDLSGTGLTDDLLGGILGSLGTGNILETLNLSNLTELTGSGLTLGTFLPKLINLKLAGDKAILSGLTGILSNLTGLQSLDLSNLGLTGTLGDGGANDLLSGVLSGLTGLDVLQALDLSGNGGITNIDLSNPSGVLDGVLDGLLSLNANDMSGLVSLNGSGTGLVNVNLLNDDELLGLNLAGADIATLSNIGGLRLLGGLEVLDLSDNGLFGALDLTGLTGLNTLNLADNAGITGLNLGGLLNLKNLNVEGVTGLVGSALNLVGSGLIDTSGIGLLDILGGLGLNDVLADGATITGLDNGLIGTVLDTLFSALGLI